MVTRPLISFAYAGRETAGNAVRTAFHAIEDRFALQAGAGFQERNVGHAVVLAPETSALDLIV